MRAVDLIIKKRDGQTLTFDEMEYMIMGYVKNSIPDYQMSAFLMACFLNDLSHQETFHLTKIMKDSGDQMDMSGISRKTIDKHSTGGVGDKTSLIVAPLVACFNCAMPKMSGRGLGHTGGTIDKLESVPGFKVELSSEEFFKQVEKTGVALIAQTGNMTPADKKLYALRDVTGTVDSIPLIVGSIMSKKLAAGAETIILDVKCGSGAFMKDLEEATVLAENMVEIGKTFNKNIRAIISDMNQPLGYAIGNALEVIEAIDTLKGNGPDDLYQLCEEIVVQALLSSDIYQDEKKARFDVGEKIKSGEALAKFAEFIAAQGGNAEVINDYRLLNIAENKKEIIIDESGYISSVNAEKIGYASMLLGAGRATKDDLIDMGVGIRYLVKVGQEVKPGDVLAEVYFNDGSNVAEVLSIMKEETKIVENKPEVNDLIYRIIE